MWCAGSISGGDGSLGVGFLGPWQAGHRPYLLAFLMAQRMKKAQSQRLAAMLVERPSKGRVTQASFRLA